MHATQATYALPQILTCYQPVCLLVGRYRLPSHPHRPPLLRLQVESLERFVQEASTLVDRRLIDTLFNKFNLAKHCDAMRRYVLLGQGDFVQALMDMVGGSLGWLLSSC